MKVLAVASGDDRAARSLQYVKGYLHDSEVNPIRVDRPWSRVDREGSRVERRFQHTPAPLVDAWRMARLLQRRTKPGDVVLLSDHAGLGGLFALAQAAAPAESRRVLWTVAADSAYLEMRLIAGTHQGLPMPLDSQIDWEITQYRWSDRVLATSSRSVDELARIGVGAELVGEPSGAAATMRPVETNHIWAPGPVSRRNQSGEVLRAVTSLAEGSITLGADDEPDMIWSGSSWEALRHSRSVLGPRVDRSEKPPADPGVIVLGNPYAPPDDDVIALTGQGFPVVVPEDSVASLLWPDAPTWRDSDELVRVLTGAQTSPLSRISVPARGAASPQLHRDREVSVGIPVFREVSYLSDCVESVLSQDLQPIEILLIDDGSDSVEVDRILQDLADTDPRIRIIRSEHRGVCVARNTALEQMTGDSFLFIDSDDLILPTFLSSCATMLESSTDLWAVATWTEFFGAYEGIEAKPPFDHRVGLRENPIISTCALVDMRVREAGIRFAPGLAFLFCEDWHFWSQIAAAGGRFGLVPDPLARHRVHTSSGGFLRTDVAHAAGRSRAIGPLLQTGV